MGFRSQHVLRSFVKAQHSNLFLPYNSFLLNDAIYLTIRNASSNSFGKRKTHYQVLGLGKSASNEDIRAAFLKKSKESHPDVNRSNPENHKIFIQVNEAYSVLSKPNSRRYYDSTLNDGHASNKMTSSHGDAYYHRPKDCYGSEEWLRQNGLKEEYFRSAHSKNQHYGKAGLNPISNVHIVAFCLMFMTLGIVLHLLVIKRSSERHLQNLNDRDLRTQELWLKAKQDAKGSSPREFAQQLFDMQKHKNIEPKE